MLEKMLRIAVGICIKLQLQSLFWLPRPVTYNRKKPSKSGFNLYVVALPVIPVLADVAILTVIIEKSYVEPDVTNKLLSLRADHVFQFKDTFVSQFQATKVFHLYDTLPFFGDSSMRPPARDLAAYNCLQDHLPELTRYQRPIHAIFINDGARRRGRHIVIEGSVSETLITWKISCMILDRQTWRQITIEKDEDMMNKCCFDSAIRAVVCKEKNLAG